MVATAVPLVRDGIVERLAKLTEEQVAAAAPYLADVMESAETDNLTGVNHYSFRRSLNLKGFLPTPTITELPGVVLPPKSKPHSERIDDGGYDWSDSNIKAGCFPVTLDAGPAPLVLAHFGVDVEGKEVEEWAQANGYVQAFNEDLLAVGAHPKYRDLQRQFTIVQLGSSTILVGHRYVSDLDISSGSSGGAGRILHLRYYDAGCNYRCRFLLRKVS